MPRLRRLRSIGDILTSPEMVKVLSTITGDIAENVSDPNPLVRATLRTRIFESSGGGGAAPRAVGQVGIAPWLGGVEAARGPLAKAVGRTR